MSSVSQSVSQPGMCSLTFIKINVLLEFKYRVLIQKTVPLHLLEERVDL